MSMDPVEELRSSLKNLYNDAEFSDLTIASRETEYRVHKAIVCPRSDYFAQQCREAKSKAAAESFVALPDDDPQAIGMVVRYFYHLDYPSEPSEPSVNDTSVNGHTHAHAHHTHTNGNVNGHSNGINGADDGLNGSVKSDDHPLLDRESKTDDPSESLDDFLPPQPPRLSKKKAKKKSKSHTKPGAEPQAIIDPPASPPPVVAAAAATEVPILGQAQENHSEGGGAVLESKPAGDGSGIVEAVSTLVLHANVYALSRKYGIAGLRSLAFDKFQAEADSQWDTEEFLRAAEKVYTSCSDGDDDRRMKDVVVGMICRHGELMDKGETQNVMRTLPKDLMYDILMQVRQQGGFAI